MVISVAGRWSAWRREFCVMGIKEKREHWAGVIARWRESGLSHAEFCRANSLKVLKFQYWLRRERRLAAGGGADGFVQVQAEPERGCGLVLRFPSGMELVIGSGFDEAALRRVVSCLGRTAC